ncbi:S-layer homology domain-containing protein [Paenibacillus gansuensis]|uniref:S-layer homology domain-containing protein n=1 Tax=Paenibacillus gansuensis TaxID=306542 RepID=A0ABW5PL37_9BACL
MSNTSFQIKESDLNLHVYRGGEKKVMKKIVSVALSTAMAFSMFASVVSGAELTTTDKFNALKEKGILSGIDAAGNPGLNNSLTRAELAKILVSLTGLEPVSGASSFKDVKSGWAVSYINAANKAGLMAGTSATTFAPAGKVTVEQVARVLVVALKIEHPASPDTNASPWAKEYVAAAVKAGLIDASANPKGLALRSLIIDATYAAWNASQVAKISKFEAAGAKKLKVTFSKAVDPAAVKFAVKKGANSVSVAKTTVADDKLSATLELTNKLTKGDYVVTVSGVAKTDLTSTVSVEDEKVTAIAFNTTNAVLDATDNTKAYATYKVTNQYGEELNSTTLTVTSSVYGATASNGKVTIDATGELKVGDKINVSLLDAATGAFKSEVLTVSAKAVTADVEVKSLYNSDAAAVLSSDSTASDFKLLLDVKDQYGNKVAAADIKDDLIVSLSDYSVLTLAGLSASDTTPTFTTQKVDGVEYAAIALTGISKGGKVTVQIISKATGDIAKFDVTVKEGVKADAITLTAPELAVAGEDITIPATVLDLDGKEITNADKLNTGSAGKGVNLSSTAGTGSSIGFVQDYVNNKAKLVLKGVTSAGKVTVTAITANGKFANVVIDVKEAKKPVVVSATKDIVTNLLVGGSFTLNKDSIVVQDQYGREIDENAAGYTVKVTKADSDDQVSITGNYASGYTVAGVKKGSVDLTLTLMNGATEVKDSSFTITSNVVEKSQITSYEVADVAKVYAVKDNAVTKYDKEVKVNGVTAGGVKVAVPTSEFTVTSATYGVTVTGNKVHADQDAVNFGSNTTVDASLVVVVKANNQQPVTKTVQISKEAPTFATIEVVEEGGVKKIDANTISASKAAVNSEAEVKALATSFIKAVDQYGVEITGDVYTTVISNVTDGKDITAVEAGNSFTVTAVTSNGKTLVIKVIVTA